MGCGSSSIDSAARRRIKQSGTNKINQNFNKNGKVETIITNINHFEAITYGCKTISGPPNTMPVVCLSSESFPLITSFLHLEDLTPTDIKLPVVSAGIFGAGRLVCFSQYNFIIPKYLHAHDTTRFITNALNWVSEKTPQVSPMYSVGFDHHKAKILHTSFLEMGFFVENGPPKNQYSNYKAVIVPSDLDISDQEVIENIVEYVQNGGALIVFYIHTEISNMTIPFNKLLLRFNMAFTCCFLHEDEDFEESINVPVTYAFVKDSNFVPLLSKFKCIIKQSHVDTSALDDIVTTLRYYIMVCDKERMKQLLEIEETSWEYMKRSHYHTVDGICPKLTHGIIAVLLIDLYTKLPLEHVKPIPEAEISPGLTGDVVLEDFTVTVHLQNESWISTGLWLPAGTIGTVECNKIISDVYIQIGSHHESLVTKQAPWKRWPLIVYVTSISELVTKTVSAFGGIVYIAVNNIEDDTTKELNVTFRNFCRHPISKYDDPHAWELTKDIQVPWGEIHTDNIIFTLPTEYMKKIGDFSRINEKFSIIVRELTAFMSYPIERPYRIVFDIELPEDSPSCGYPLVFLIDDIPGILLSFDEPTTQLFTAVTLMAIVSIREDCFDTVTETALATIATSVIFKKLFKNFDPIEFTGIMLPTLFKELWDIQCNCDPTIIPKTLATFQDPSYPVSNVPPDRWISFVREMCRVGKLNFTKILEKARPIPLNISTSLQGLPPYQASQNYSDS